MAADDRSIALAPGEGRTLPLGANALQWKATGDETGGRFALMELTTVPGSGSPLHVHHNEDEAFFVLEGTLTIYLGKRVVRATPGSFTLIPRGLLHAFVNRGTETVRSLVTLSPAGLEGFFETTAGPDAPRDAASFAALCARYGLEFFGPPPAAEE